MMQGDQQFALENACMWSWIGYLWTPCGDTLSIVGGDCGMPWHRCVGEESRDHRMSLFETPRRPLQGIEW